MMRFLGFGFEGVDLPHGLTYTPEGWTDNLSLTVTRSAAAVRDWTTDDGTHKQLRPIALESTGLPKSLDTTQVINSLVAAATNDTTGSVVVSRATELPTVLSKRVNVLQYASMQGAMCAGFMISTFKYEFEDAPEPKQEKNPSPNPHKGSKHRVAQDALVGTAFNLAKKSVGNPVTELHSDKVNHKQVHTEQLLCGQIDAFLTMVIDPISRPKVINVLDRFGYKSQAFDPKKMTVNVKIVFEHSKGNVKEDCKACSATIKRITDKWEPKLKGFDIAVSKNS